MLHFLLIPFRRPATKMMDRIAWKEFINLPQSPKSIKKPKSFAEHDLENIKIVTLSMHLINTLMLYRKDNLGGHSSNVCTDVRFFKKKSFFKERAGL